MIKKQLCIYTYIYIKMLVYFLKARKHLYIYMYVFVYLLLGTLSSIIYFCYVKLQSFSHCCHCRRPWRALVPRFEPSRQFNWMAPQRRNERVCEGVGGGLPLIPMRSSSSIQSNWIRSSS